MLVGHVLHIRIRQTRSLSLGQHSATLCCHREALTVKIQPLYVGRSVGRSESDARRVVEARCRTFYRRRRVSASLCTDMRSTFVVTDSRCARLLVRGWRARRLHCVYVVVSIQRRRRCDAQRRSIKACGVRMRELSVSTLCFCTRVWLSIYYRFVVCTQHIAAELARIGRCVGFSYADHSAGGVNTLKAFVVGGNMRSGRGWDKHKQRTYFSMMVRLFDMDILESSIYMYVIYSNKYSHAKIGSEHIK